jgi:hypothetical protein
MKLSHIRLVQVHARGLAVALAAVALALGPLVSPAAAGAVPPVADSPNPGSPDVLNAVSARSAGDVWAVGYYGSATGQKTLILHWNGTGWKKFASPSPGGNDTLTGVSADSATDAWAVGSYQVSCSTGGVEQKTLILRWNGISWKQFASPNPDRCTNELTAVNAVSASDAWAVGSYGFAFGSHTLVLRWNGSSWKRVTTAPSPGSRDALTGVSADSATDAWAVGAYLSSGDCGCTLILHWNGTSWKQVPSPSPGAADNQLNGVSARSGSNAWAVGWQNPGAAAYKSLILHWDGTKWSPKPSPNPGPSACDNQLQGVSADSATDAWAVGPPNCGTTNGPLILHWNGGSWQLVAAPPTPAPDLAVNGVSAASATDAWAVGAYQTPLVTLALRWNGTRWVQK